MDYAITKTTEGILLECLNGGMGSHRPRLVRGTNRTAIVAMLEAMWLRGHLSYEYYYDGSVVHAKQWERLLDDDEMNPEKLECRVTSQHDVVKLVAFSENWVRRPGFWYSRERNELRYKRPTSKKAVMASWLYQNGVDTPTP